MQRYSLFHLSGERRRLKGIFSSGTPSNDHQFAVPLASLFLVLSFSPSLSLAHSLPAFGSGGGLTSVCLVLNGENGPLWFGWTVSCQVLGGWGTWGLGAAKANVDFKQKKRQKKKKKLRLSLAHLLSFENSLILSLSPLSLFFFIFFILSLTSSV